MKTLYFQAIAKEYVQGRINTLIINEKISNKKNQYIHHHENFLNTTVNNIVTSPVLFSILQTLTTSSNKSATSVQ